MRRVRLVGRLLAVVAMLLLLCAPTADAASYQVHMSGYAFGPTQLSVKVGDTVTWTNHDQAPHNAVVTAGPARFESPMLATGQSWSFTFSQPGTYSYYCSVHPDMRAQVAVQAAATQPPAQQPPASSTKKQQQTTAPTTKAKGSAPPVAPTTATTTTDVDTPTAATEPVEDPVAAAAPARTAGPTLDPLLLVAGLVAAVATLCLLLIGSRPASS